MSRGSDIVKLGRHSHQIYIVDEDIQLLKKLGNLMSEAHQDYEIIAMTSTKDTRDEIQGSKPAVLIMSLEYVDKESDPLQLLKFIRSVELTKNMPVIVTGTRSILEEMSDKLKKYEVQFVPKAIRIPFFMGVLKTCLHTAQTTDAKILKLKKGDVLFHEGDASSSLYYLKSGGLLVYKERDDEVIKIAEVNTQQLVGEMAYIEKTLRSASIKAIEDSEVWELQIGDFEGFIEQQPFWLKLILKTLLDRLRDSNKKVLELTN